MGIQSQTSRIYETQNADPDSPDGGPPPPATYNPPQRTVKMEDRAPNETTDARLGMVNQLTAGMYAAVRTVLQERRYEDFPTDYPDHPLNKRSGATSDDALAAWITESAVAVIAGNADRLRLPTSSRSAFTLIGESVFPAVSAGIGTSNLTDLLLDKPHLSYLQTLTPADLRERYGARAVTCWEPSDGYTDPEWYWEDESGGTWGIGFRWGVARLRGNSSDEWSVATARRFMNFLIAGGGY